MVSPEEIESLEDGYIEAREEYYTLAQEDLETQKKDFDFLLNAKRFFMYSVSTIVLYFYSSSSVVGWIVPALFILFSHSLFEYLEFYNNVYKPFEEDMLLRINFLFVKWRHLFNAVGCGLIEEAYDLDLNIRVNEHNQELLNYKISRSSWLIFESVLYIKTILVLGRWVFNVHWATFYFCSIILLCVILSFGYEFASTLKRRTVLLEQYKEFLSFNKTEELNGQKIRYFVPGNE